MLWFRARPNAEPAADPTTGGAEPDDAGLVAAAQADRQAFAALYEWYVERVYRYCYLRLGNRAAAEDATSEVFCKALASLGGFRGEVFAAWLFRIAHNVVIDVHRRRCPTDPLQAAGAVSDPAPTPEEQAVAWDERERFRAALGALPGEQRLVLELQLAGWSGEQTARVLGKRLGAVKMLRFRAIARLREVLRSESAPDATEVPDA